MSISSYKDLIVWQKAMDLVEEIYHLTSQFPKDETYGIASQMQRAAVAIPSNIAEGNYRYTRKEYAQFASIALGSVAELETQLLICARVAKFQNIDFNHALEQSSNIKRMLYSMVKKLKTSSADH